jgi:hypothetical protein
MSKVIRQRVEAFRERSIHLAAALRRSFECLG